MVEASFLTPYENGPMARTNMFKIFDMPEKVIEKLLTINTQTGRITYACMEIKKQQKNEDSADFYRRVDREIKAAIRDRLGLKGSEPVQYDRLVIRKQCVLFFFIDKSGCSHQQLLKDVDRYEFDRLKVAQTIISLRLKLSYIDDVSIIYDIPPTLHNSNLYIGAFKRTIKTFKDNEAYIEALNINLYYSYENELALSLHKKAFKCRYEESFVVTGEDTNVLFRQKSGTWHEVEMLDAVRFTKRPFMCYSLPDGKKNDPKFKDKGYEYSINYHLTLTLNKLATILSDAGVKFEPIHFKANYIFDDFFESDESYANDLVIIDTFGKYVSKSQRDQFRAHLEDTFDAKSVIDVKEAPKPPQIEISNVSYLIVNEEKKDNGSSIIRLDSSEPLNSFIQAIDLSESSNCEIDFDYYTNVKLHRFKNTLPSVTQGVNIDNISPIKKSNIKQSNSSPEIPLFKPLNKNIIKKIKTELCLKEKVFHQKALDGIFLPNSNLTLFFVRKTEKKKIYISVVDLITDNNGIKISKQTTYKNKDERRFNYTYGYLKNTFPFDDRSLIDSLYNQGFYMYDKDHQKILVSYASQRVPKIIGNASFDNVEKNKEKNGIHRKRASNLCVLPYYINPTINGRLDHVFLEDCELEGVRYFVSKAGQPPEKLDKQNKVYNILVFNDDGTKALPLQEKLTELFFRSFTFDILNNNEVSKKSILQKIAELYIEN